MVYLRWERDDRHIECRLVTGNMQVALNVKITILWRPQMAQHQGVNPRGVSLVKSANLYIREKYSQFLLYRRPVHLAFTVVTPRFSR
jgi:hypothetical protein